jgi:hypothetical protein
MDFSGQFHVPAALLWRKELPVPIFHSHNTDVLVHGTLEDISLLGGGGGLAMDPSITTKYKKGRREGVDWIHLIRTGSNKRLFLTRQ